MLVHNHCWADVGYGIIDWSKMYHSLKKIPVPWDIMEHDKPNDLKRSDDVFITGYTKGGLDGNSHQGSDDIFIVKYNSDGVKQ